MAMKMKWGWRYTDMPTTVVQADESACWAKLDSEPNIQVVWRPTNAGPNGGWTAAPHSERVR